MANYAILDEAGNVLNTIVADQAFLDAQGLTRWVIIDQWLDGSMGPIDTTRRWNEKTGQFEASTTARAQRIREQADRPSDADALAATIAGKILEQPVAAVKA